MSATSSAYRSLYSLKAKYHFLKYVQDPTNTPGIFEMTQSFQKAASPAVIEVLLKPLLDNPDIKAAFENQYWPYVPSIEELKSFPLGSFGHEAFLFF